MSDHVPDVTQRRLVGCPTDRGDDDTLLIYTTTEPGGLCAIAAACNRIFGLRCMYIYGLLHLVTTQVRGCGPHMKTNNGTRFASSTADCQVPNGSLSVALRPHTKAPNATNRCAHIYSKVRLFCTGRDSAASATTSYRFQTAAADDTVTIRVSSQRSGTWQN